MTKELTDCQFSDKVSGLASRISQPFATKLCGMYAISPRGGVYHLVNEALDRTLCGLVVPPIIINRPTQSSTTYLSELKPEAQTLCEACRKQFDAEAEVVDGT